MFCYFSNIKQGFPEVKKKEPALKADFLMHLSEEKEPQFFTDCNTLQRWKRLQKMESWQACFPLITQALYQGKYNWKQETKLFYTNQCQRKDKQPLCIFLYLVTGGIIYNTKMIKPPYGF